MCDQLRQLGDSDLFVSPVAMGCWPIAGMTSLNVSETESIKTINAAVESGINFFDTAHCYGLDGVSERLVGRVLSERRDDFVIATKCGVHWDSNAQKVIDGSLNRLMTECDESLRRLGTDHIDLMYLHEPDPTIPIEESASAMAQMIELGKVRSVGMSNVTAQQLVAFGKVCPVVAVQPPFNLLQQQIKDELVPWCQQNQISIVNYWPLMKGLLAGKIRRGHEFEPNDKRLTYEIFQGETFEFAQTVLDGLDQIAAETELTVAQLVIAWTINQPYIAATLCGAKRDWQIRETAGAMKAKLSQSAIDRIGNLVRNSPQKTQK